MNLLQLKNQIKNKFSNYYFKRDELIRNYFIQALKAYDYFEILADYKLEANERIIMILENTIEFSSNHLDLAHAKHEALAILDHLENKFRKDFTVSMISGVKDGAILMFFSSSSTYQQLVSIKFVKNKKSVGLKGELLLNQRIRKTLEDNSYKNIFKPYLVSVFPIQLNDKEVLQYGNQIVQKVKHRFLHDTSEINHSEKAKITSNLKLPYSISYGLKDLGGLTVNVYNNLTDEYSRVKLNKLNELINKENSVKLIKDFSKTLYLCNAKKCQSAISKLDGILLTPFNQIILDKKCHICNSTAMVKYTSIKVGESI
jgi:hypothetical protein